MENALAKEDLFWHKKYIVSWHIEGDRNVAFFHRMDRIKNNKNIITYLIGGEEIIVDPVVMACHAIKFFTKILCVAGNSQETQT